MNISKKAKVRIGTVVSDKMDKTVTVLIERLVEHPLYHRVVKKRKKVFAHDEKNISKSGDIVRIIETRPLSRHKRWKVEEILKRAE
ncbi:MAG: 30S ribosomal protein S17 [bacterium]